MRGPVIFAVLLFVISTAAGFGAPSRMAETLAGELAQAVVPLLQHGPLVLFLFIFLNNAVKSLLAIVLGLLLGLPPAFLLAVNGFLVGALTRQAAAQSGYPVVLASLVPHGVLEIPAVILSCALGFRLGAETLLFLTRRRGHPVRRLRGAVRVFARWVAPTLALAAGIEVFVTPLVRSLFAAG